MATNTNSSLLKKSFNDFMKNEEPSNIKLHIYYPHRNEQKFVDEEGVLNSHKTLLENVCSGRREDRVGDGDQSSHKEVVDAVMVDLEDFGILGTITPVLSSDGTGCIWVKGGMKNLRKRMCSRLKYLIGKDKKQNLK